MSKWVVFILSGLGVLFGVWLALRSIAPQPVPPLAEAPVRNPFPKGIAGSGLIEPASENVVIGVTDPGLVTKLFVKEGDRVEAGAPLFQIDPRSLEADLLTAQAAAASARADLERTQAYRRKEDEPPLRARLAQTRAALKQVQQAVPEAEANVLQQEWSLKDAQATVQRLEVTVKANASPKEDLEKAQFAEKAAEARLQGAREALQAARAQIPVAQAGIDQAQADLNIYLAGAWDQDVRRAKAALNEAQARVEALKINIGRRTIRAPIAATVLRVSLHEGEYASIGTAQADNAPLVLGDVRQINVRTDIDEFDASRFRPGAKAEAFPKGDSRTAIALEFVRVDPFVIPKRQLTNTQRELVDTRVLEVIYKIVNPPANIYVGQQLDVFINAE